MYAPLLFDKDVFGEDAIRLLKMFRVPYKQIASTAFIPRPEIYDQAKRFWVEKLKGKRWVAVHNRGFYDGEGKGVFGVFRFWEFESKFSLSFVKLFTYIKPGIILKFL